MLRIGHFYLASAKEINGVAFYIRNDKIDKYEWPSELQENKIRKIFGLNLLKRF